LFHIFAKGTLIFRSGNPPKKNHSWLNAACSLFSRFGLKKTEIVSSQTKDGTDGDSMEYPAADFSPQLAFGGMLLGAICWRSAC
jgi:hypothetical protein